MYSQKQKDDIINQICTEIESGKSLRSVLIDSKPISQKVFYEWIDSDIEKSKQYVRACEARADSIFEDILDIADEATKDIIIKDGVELVNSENIQRSRLKVDARKWMLGKMNPKKYGEKLQQDITIREQPLFPDE